MYLPKSKYKGPFTASGGEEGVLYKDTKEPFNGKYIITFRKQLFEGNSPLLAGRELIFEKDHLLELQNINPEKRPTSKNITPTEKDYSVRYYKRYFAKDNRSEKIIEIDSKEFNKVSSYPSFSAISLDWWIEGPSEDTSYDGIVYKGAKYRNNKAVSKAQESMEGIQDYLFLLDEFVV
jgi:hypothetical protein|tara:strand:+ start:4876 stop:5409 length:534 start_codon:yes stop_codon:yes gene_type:complete